MPPKCGSSPGVSTAETRSRVSPGSGKNSPTELGLGGGTLRGARTRPRLAKAPISRHSQALCVARRCRVASSMTKPSNEGACRCGARERFPMGYRVEVRSPLSLLDALAQAHSPATSRADRTFVDELDAGGLQCGHDFIRLSITPRTIPLLASIRWMVGSDTPDAAARALCSIPTSARAAFNWVAVSKVVLQCKCDSVSKSVNQASYIISDFLIKSQASRFRSCTASIPANGTRSPSSAASSKRRRGLDRRG